MKRERNIFGDENTPQPGENNNKINQNFNLFNNNRSNKQKKYAFNESPNRKKTQVLPKKKLENFNNFKESLLDTNDKNISTNQMNKNILKESVNLNIFPENEENNYLNIYNNIENNINNINHNSLSKSINNRAKPNSQIKNRSKLGSRLYNKDNNNSKNININININNNNPLRINNININNSNNHNILENKNNNNIRYNNIENKKERVNLSKSVISFNENKKNNNTNNQIMNPYTNKIIKKKPKQTEEMIKKKEEENEINRAQIRDNLKCYVCMDKLKNPRICKYCHRAACSNCLRLWLQNKSHCGYCRHKIIFDETLEIPIIDEKFSDFFLKNLDKQNSNLNENNDINGDSGNINSDIIQNKLDKDISKNICSLHNKKLEYFCVQCNNIYCQKCLSVLNVSAKIHQNHTIIPTNKMKNNEKMTQIIEEYNKLNQTNTQINNLLNLCNLKLRELEIEKNNIIGQYNNIKDEMKGYFYDKLKNIDFEFEKIKSSDEEIGSTIETTPLALMNIVKLKDYGQGKKIYERISNLNNFISEDYLLKQDNHKNLYLENFLSETIEIPIPNVFSKIIRKNFNFLPNIDFLLSIKNNGKIQFVINIINKNNNLENAKFLCFVVFQKPKYGCEFINLKSQKKDKQTDFCDEIESKIFFSFKDENNKIKFKLYFLICDYN